MGNPAALLSTGVRSSKVKSESTTPHGCIAICRGSPSIASTKLRKLSIFPVAANLPNDERLSSGKSTNADVTLRARMWGNALANASISEVGKPNAKPTSRIAERAL